MVLNKMKRPHNGSFKSFSSPAQIHGGRVRQKVDRAHSPEDENSAPNCQTVRVSFGTVVSEKAREHHETVSREEEAIEGPARGTNTKSSDYPKEECDIVLSDTLAF